MKIDVAVTFRKREIFMTFMESRNIARTGEILGISGVNVHRALPPLRKAFVVRCVFTTSWKAVASANAGVSSVLAPVQRFPLRSALNPATRATLALT